MKATTLKKAALLAGSLSFLAGSAFSQTAVSGAGGYKTENLLDGFNLMGVSLLPPVATSGALASEAGDTITVASPADLAAVLTDPDATYAVEILDGAQAGAVAEISNITATTFDVAGGLGAGAAAYQIRPLPTLNEVFGTQLTGGTFVGPTTDIVWLDAAGATQAAYNTGGAEFRNTAGFFLPAPKAVSVFYPDGMFVQINGGAKDVVITGMVKTTDTVVAANSGFNLVGVTPPVGSTLGNAGLEGTLNGVGFVGPTADIVWAPDGAGGFFQFAYNSTATQWRSTGQFFNPAPFDPANPAAGGDATNFALPSGIFIQRNDPAGDTAGNLTVPPFYANL